MITTIKRSVVALAVAAFIPAAIGYADQRVGNYDFNYMTSGDQRSLPVQVFDDGKNTYFQFRAGDPIPAIFSAKSGAVKLLVPTFEGPYVRVTETAGQFALQLGKSQSQVFYVKGGRDDSAAIDAVSPTGVKSVFSSRTTTVGDPYRLVATFASASTQNVAPPAALADSLEANSYATPTKGDRVSWGQPETETLEKQVWFVLGATLLDARAKKDLAAIAQEAKGAASVTVVGRDDSSEKEGLEKARANNIRDELLKAGVPADRIKLKIAVMGTPKGKAWPSDVRIERVVPNLIGRVDSANERIATVQRAAEMLVREKILTREQAAALFAARADGRPGPPAPAAASPAQLNIAATAPADVPASGFDFKLSDKTISGALKRWAASTRYEIIWDAPPSVDPLITQDSAISATSMHDAIDKVLTGLQKKGYDIQGTLYSNRVVRFSAAKSL